MIGNLFALIKGTANKATDALVDMNPEIILDQGIRDDEQKIREAKIQISKLDAECKMLRVEVQSLKDKKVKATDYASKKMDAGDDEGAIAILDMMDLEVTPVLAPKEVQLENMLASVEKLKKALAKGEKSLSERKSTVEMAKTQIKVNKATEAATSTTLKANSNSEEMKRTLERLQKKASLDGHALDSLNEMNTPTSSLDDLLKEDSNAGLTLKERLAKAKA